MSQLADFRPVMRVVLDDNDADLGYDLSDAQLDSGLTAAYMLGAWPAGFELAGAAITPDVVKQKDFAVIALEAVWVMTVGGQGAYSFKTRALSETDMGQRKRDLIQYCRDRIYQMRDADAVFSSRETLLNFLGNFKGLAGVAEAVVSPPPAISVPLDRAAPIYFS